MTRLLHDNITEGTGTAAYTGCPGQAGKTGTTDRETDAWFAGYQPNLASVVWVGYPQSNAIEMTSVHGITVFGGTFPAEIWHSLYSGGEVPCEEFEKPKHADQLGALLRPVHRRGAAGHGKGVYGNLGSGIRTGARNWAKKRPAATTPTPTRPVRARNRRRCRLLRRRPASVAAVRRG